MRSRLLILLALCVAPAALLMPALGADGNGAEVAMLKKVGSRVSDKAGVITIEASEPVPYVASQPDPRTFVVELREVVALGFADNFSVDPRHPVAAVQVETLRGADGVNVARIRMTLAHPTRPRVRSSRNVITVEADRLDRAPTAGGVIGIAGPAAAIRDLRVAKRGAATTVTLLGTGRLLATSVEQPKDGPRRLVIDLPNVTSSLPVTTPVGQGPVGDVRIGVNPRAPLVTQVTMHLTRQAAYRVEASPNGNDLTVVFDEPATEAFAALAQAQAPAAPAVPPMPAQIAPAAPAQTAPMPAPQTPVAAPAGPSRYTGHTVSLDFQGADLRAVLRTFAEISGLNIVIDPTIQGTVDVALRDVPWDQALDIILRANRLGYVVDGTIVRIAPLSALQAEQEELRKLAEAQALSGELRTMTRALSYAKAEELTALLTATALSQRGSIQTDPRTNTVIITDLADRLVRAQDLLTALDRPEPQVEIEARIVETTREFAREIGVQWGFNGRASQALGNTLPLAFPNQGSIGGRTGQQQGPPPPAGQEDSAANVVNLGVSGATSALGLALGSVNGAVNLDVALSALEGSGQGRLLSTPRVSTQNNVEAEITQGEQIPIQTVANNTVTVTFKDAALTLRVRPQITAADTVIMTITLENAVADFSRQVNGIPPINTQRAQTQVLVSNGDTTVIGGIYVSRETENENRTPGLHRIPLLGWLFKYRNVTDESRELLIFITPRIIRL